MEDRPHKAHRPAHSGGKAEKKDKGKGKEKQHGFNEKVSYNIYISNWHLIIRPLLQNQGETLTVKVVETLSETRRGFTYL